MAVIELVTEAYTPSAPKHEAGAKKSSARRLPRETPAPAAEVEEPTTEAPRPRSRRPTRPARTQVVETEAADVETPPRRRPRPRPSRGRPTSRCRGAEARGTTRPDPSASTQTRARHRIAVAGPRASLQRLRCATAVAVGEVGVHEGYDAGALAGRGGDPLHRPGADVAGGEDARAPWSPGWPAAGRRASRSLGTSRPVSTKPCSSRQTSSGSQSHCGSAPSSRNSPPASCRVHLAGVQVARSRSTPAGRRRRRRRPRAQSRTRDPRARSCISRIR